MYTAIHWLYINIAESDINSFIPAWAAYRGLLATPNVLLQPDARKTHLGLTPHLVRLFRKADVVTLEKELEIEKVRRLHYPTSISRLNCLYCWPDEATARLAPKYWTNQGRHFDENFLVEIGVTSHRAPSVVDTRWIDKNVINSSDPLSKIGTDWIHQYWSGSVYPWNGDHDVPTEPLMECLVDGTALIYGTSLRTAAYPLVEAIAPDSVGILEKGRLGVDISTRVGHGDEWRLGQTVPVLMTNENRTALCVRHLICLDEALAKAVNEKVFDVGIKTNEINFKALEVFKRDSLKLPDLLVLDVNLDWLQTNPDLNAQVNETLTAFFLDQGGNIDAAIEHQRGQSKTRIPQAPSAAEPQA